MVATVSSFVRRQATAEPIAEPSDVSKNKSLLASRVNFYFLFGVSDVDVILAYIYLALPRHLMSLLALFSPEIVSLSLWGTRSRAHSHLSSAVTEAVTMRMFFTLPPAS